MSLYLEAASILQSPQTTSLKSIIYKPSKPFKSPQSKLYALIVETLKFQDILKEVIENAEILKFERKLTPLLSVLLVHDLLLARSGIAASSGPLKDAVLRHKARLNAEFTRVRIKRGYVDVKALVNAVNAEHGRESEDGVATSSTGLTTFNPRWIRVNTLKTRLSDVLDSSHTFDSFKEVSGMSDMFFSPTVQKHYYRKPELLPEIFSIHPSHDVTSSEQYKSGKIILQSAASCLPAIMLNPPKGSVVVDGCAAPGNKTTHLAAIVGSKGKVFGVERDKYRAEVLEKMVKKAGADNIIKTVKATDFTTITEGHEAWEASYLLLDPSCSGSGILERIDWDISKLNLPSAGKSSTQALKPQRKRKREDAGYASADNAAQPGEQMEESIEQDTTRDRLLSLADFQLAIVLHAFTFPNAKRMTYSTCSIHAEENERVVLRALQSNVAKARGWRVQSRKDNPLSTWHRRGLVNEFADLDAHEEERKRTAEGCIRVNRTDGLGGGFFVVCFVRDTGDAGQLDPDSTNQHLSATNDGDSQPEEGDMHTTDTNNKDWDGISGIAIEGAMSSETTKKRRKKKSLEAIEVAGAKMNRHFLPNKRGWP
ncbi:hypothetical protein H072_5733 [Dactylellina haptotyla CBS 200.50]|uniref:SAM-dependent MTase RsmB/NOP-type domain-containing protein n=1 Tax=Dactylellina haptotyla (strain CBS 200.50) TaxID=1284197 RepID=S8ABZ0_DACHA|nr:hypothetical protein H072_5733 [Dactylellina haptotyla CBS 200.50]